MNTLILILLGIGAGLLVSKSRYQKYWDIITGVLGALATSLILIPESTGYNPYAFLEITLGAAAIIYIGRLIQNLPQI